ncbi:hypothetical protein VTL71DRAFT_5219 [Oculimacula yallundae]|uniref:Uncharacterized protein n=1 Tax=Oculimacula yallundae TaxID=86028 RepID=A0ABR4C0H2_9HELO
MGFEGQSKSLNFQGCSPPNDDCVARNYASALLCYREYLTKQKAHFGCKFTRFVPGIWDRRDVLDNWEELVKVLIGEIHLRKSEKTPMIRQVIPQAA